MAKFCYKCGTEILNNSKFCMICGAKVIAPERSKAPEKSVKKMKTEKQDNLQMGNSQTNGYTKTPVNEPSPSYYQQNSAHKKYNQKIIFISISVMVIVIIAVILAIVLTGGNGNGSENGGNGPPVDGVKARFFGSWNYQGVVWTFNSNLVWSISGEDIGYWNIMNNQIHLTSESDVYSFMNGAYDFNFLNGDNNLVLEGIYFDLNLEKI